VTRSSDRFGPKDLDMLIAQISDLHVAEDGEFMRRFVDSNAKLEAAVGYLNGLARPPDVVVATGDLADHGRAGEYGLLREIVDQLAVPLVVIPGNHDELGPFHDAFADHEYLPPDGPVQYAIDDYSVRLVALDTTRPGHHEGELDHDSLRWLDETLAARRDTPTLVMLHHPPFDSGIWWMDCLGLEDARGLETVIRRHPQVRRVIAGHLHRPIDTNWGSTVVSVAPSTCHQTRCDLHPDHEPVLDDEPPMLQLHWWTDDRFVSHTTVFESPTKTIDIAALVSDWPAAKARIKEGPPFAKGGVFG
jgi:3',5'-cyclic AMP phosphodiesterase CpdA